MMKISIKREQSQAGLSFAERENRRSLAGGESNFRPQVKNKLLLLLALLMTAATGAWAQTTYTIKFEANGNSKTVENVTLPHTFSCDYSGENGELDQIIKQLYGLSGGCCAMNSPGASGNSNVTAGMNGDNQFITISAPFEGNATVTGSYFDAAMGYSDFDYSLTISCPGYTPAGYTVSLKDGVKDADKWTVKVGDGQAQALPIGGLKGDGSETVTLQYTGRLKVKGVKATSDAAPATVPVTSITLNKTATTISAGSTETLSVTAVAPDNATDKTYTWKTSDASKATVDQDGKVTAVAAGTVTIYAEANDGSGVKGNCTVTVTPATITVTWNNNDITSSGKSFTKDGVTMNVTGILCDFSDKNFTAGTFTSTVGNFTKIEVTAMDFGNMGSGWSVSSGKATWTGTASSTVSFGGSDFMDGIWGMGGGVTMVFTIE